MQFIAQVGILILRHCGLVFQLVAQRFHLLFGFGAESLHLHLDLFKIAHQLRFRLGFDFFQAFFDNLFAPWKYGLK